MPRITEEELSTAIAKVRDELLAAGRYGSATEINAGYCDDFCSDVYEELGGVGLCENEGGLATVGIDGFMTHEDDEPVAFDRDLVRRAWPAFVPPPGMDWDDMDRLAADANFSCGTHVWIARDGRHYDAEAPQGVENPLDLPFFVRVVSSWRDERPSPSP